MHATQFLAQCEQFKQLSSSLPFSHECIIEQGKQRRLPHSNVTNTPCMPHRNVHNTALLHVSQLRLGYLLHVSKTQRGDAMLHVC